MKVQLFSILTLLFGLTNSCTIPKEARIFEKTTKSWRESNAVLHGYADTPLAGIFLTLRENGKFEHTSSGMFKSFQAGTWTKNQDTIKLCYLNSQLQVSSQQNVFIDRVSSTLQFEGDDSPPQMRLRILLNKL